MNRQKRIKRKRIEELKRKVKRETIKLSIVFVTGVGYGRYALNYSQNVVLADVKPKVIQKTKIESTSTSQIDAQTEAKQVEEYNCTLGHETACKIKKKALEIGMTEEQAIISVAISKWETGSWTSVAYNQKNNIGGMMCKSGLISYSSLEDGINSFVVNLKQNYFDLGLDTLEKIQPKYCPIGAKNDPTGLNKNWLSGTKKMYEELKEA